METGENWPMHQLQLIVSLISTLIAAQGACAANIAVHDAASLEAALAAAAAGDRIEISPGSYGSISLVGRHFAPALTLVSADALSPPVFTSIYLSNVTGLKIFGLKIVFGATQAPDASYAVYLFNGQDVQFEEMDISSADDGVAGNDAYGIFVRDSNQIKISNNHVHDVFRGAAIFDSTDVLVGRNVITDVGSDGVVGRGVVRGSISRNYFTDFDIIDPRKVHPDAIQIWPRGARRGSQDVIIDGNIIRRGNGEPSQGILIGGPEFVTKDLLIVNNVIEQSMGQGIALSNVETSEIANNTVLPHDFQRDAPGIDIRTPGVGVTVRANLASAYRLDPKVSAHSNIRIDYHNPWVDEFVGNYISSPADPLSPGDFKAISTLGAQDFVRDLWVGEIGAPQNTLTPPRVIVDLNFGDGINDLSANPVLFKRATDSFGDTYYVSDSARKLTAALNLKIDVRCRLGKTSPGYRYLASVSNSYDVRVNRDKIQFSVWTDGGVTRLVGTSPAMLDLAAHDLSLGYDGVGGRMTIWVDGVLIASRTAPLGPIAYFPSYRLNVGGAPWGGNWGGGIEKMRISR